MPHTHQEAVSFITHIIKFSGESRAGPQTGPKIERGGGKEVEFLCSTLYNLGLSVYQKMMFLWPKPIG